jgi:hypothetical protein
MKHGDCFKIKNYIPAAGTPDVNGCRATFLKMRDGMVNCVVDGQRGGFLVRRDQVER